MGESRTVTTPVSVGKLGSCGRGVVYTGARTKLHSIDCGRMYGRASPRRVELRRDCFLGKA